MTYTHAIVWLDHRHAKVVKFSRDDSTTHEIHGAGGKVHTKAGAPGSGHAADDHQLFDDIVAEVGNVPEVMIGGPGTAKQAFHNYVKQRHHAFAERVAAVETLDHPTDGELLAHARKSFKAVDQLGLL